MTRVLTVACALLLIGCGAQASRSVMISTAACHARANGALPDPVCTPGITNPDVTQQTIGSTICVPGWAAKVRPPESYTEPLKRKLIIRYGYTDRRLGDYELDHEIPLAVAGSPRAVANLWPEPIKSARMKDRVENALHRRVCDGTMSLMDAQHRIVADWRTALR